MLRIRAVKSLLIGEVASLRVPEMAAAAGEGEEKGAEEALRAAHTAQEAREREVLARARRRAVLVVCLDAAALLVLFLFRDRGRTFLPTGPQEETVFTLGVILIAVHLGFRLGQYFTYRNVGRVVDELDEREAG
jgi:hypothetical protein